MWHEIVCYFDQLGSIMAQESVESIRNELETTGHNAHVPRRANLSVNTMQCLAIPLFLSIQRQPSLLCTCTNVISKNQTTVTYAAHQCCCNYPSWLDLESVLCSSCYAFRSTPTKRKSKICIAWMNLHVAHEQKLVSPQAQTRCLEIKNIKNEK